MSEEKINQEPLVTSMGSVSEVKPTSNKPIQFLFTQEEFKAIQMFLPKSHSLYNPKNHNKNNYRTKTSSVITPVFDTDKEELIKRRRTRESNLSWRLNTEWGLKCKYRLDNLKNHHCAGPFLQPVDPVLLGIPDYFTIITKPMDFSTISKKLSSGEYQTSDEFDDDIKLTFKNALTYNGPSNPVYKMAVELSNFFDNLKNEEQKKDSIKKTHKSGSNRNGSGEFEGEYKKKNSSKNGFSDKPLTISEKKNLSQMVRQLPPSCLWDVWRIVSPENQNLSTEEMEFDIDTLPVKIARELESYVKGKLNEINKKKLIVKKPPSENQNMNGSSKKTNIEGRSSEDRQDQPQKDKMVINSDSSFISNLDDSDYN